MPGDATPVRLVAEGATLLVGGRRSDSRPTMHVMLAGELRPLAVRPAASSPYATLARWQSLALLGSRLTAIGGAPGGAHANTRWTTWHARLSGDWTQAGVTEWPQVFWTFGGWEAGGLVDAVATPRGHYIVGAWNGTTGLDIAVWHENGQRWARRASAGTALASSPTALTGATAATSTGTGILVTGSITHLGGSVRRAAAVWRSTSGDSGWTRLDLPGSGAAGEARSAACAADGCVVAGVVDGRYALWWVPPAGAGEPSRVGGVPDWPVADRQNVPTPLRRGERLWCLLGSVLLVRTDGVWAVRPGPAAQADTEQGGTERADTERADTEQGDAEQGGTEQADAQALDAVNAAGTVYVITGTRGALTGTRLWRTEWTDHD